MQVKGRPDLIVNRVTVEGVPVSVARGASFTITGVVRNEGLADAGASTTKFYLVLTPGAAQKKALTGTQSVPVLLPDTRHRTQMAVNVEEDTTPGTYHVLACADEVDKVVAESDENNNCTTSVETLVVTQ